MPDAKAFDGGDHVRPFVLDRVGWRGDGPTAGGPGRLRRLAARQARHDPPDQAKGPARTGRDAIGRECLAHCREACERQPAGPARVQGGTVRGRLERAAHHPRRAKRRHLHCRNARRAHSRPARHRWRGKAVHRRDLRNRPQTALRNCVLSGWRQPAMGLCRQYRQRRALPLSFRRPQGFGPA